MSIKSLSMSILKKLFEDILSERSTGSVMISFEPPGDVYPHSLRVHAEILNSQPYFRRMLRGPNRESTTRKLVVEVEARRAFIALLRFLYTGEVEEDPSVIPDLLCLADRYCIDSLRDYCLAWISEPSHFSPELFYSVLPAAELESACGPILRKTLETHMQASRTNFRNVFDFRKQKVSSALLSSQRRRLSSCPSFSSSIPDEDGGGTILGGSSCCDEARKDKGRVEASQAVFPLPQHFVQEILSRDGLPVRSEAEVRLTPPCFLSLPCPQVLHFALKSVQSSAFDHSGPPSRTQLLVTLVQLLKCVRKPSEAPFEVSATDVARFLALLGIPSPSSNPRELSVKDPPFVLQRSADGALTEQEGIAGRFDRYEGGAHLEKDRLFLDVEEAAKQAMEAVKAPQDVSRDSKDTVGRRSSLDKRSQEVGALSFSPSLGTDKPYNWTTFFLASRESIVQHPGFHPGERGGKHRLKVSVSCPHGGWTHVERRLMSHRTRGRRNLVDGWTLDNRSGSPPPMFPSAPAHAVGISTSHTVLSDLERERERERGQGSDAASDGHASVMSVGVPPRKSQSFSLRLPSGAQLGAEPSDVEKVSDPPPLPYPLRSQIPHKVVVGVFSGLQRRGVRVSQLDNDGVYCLSDLEGMREARLGGTISSVEFEMELSFEEREGGGGVSLCLLKIMRGRRVLLEDRFEVSDELPVSVYVTSSHFDCGSSFTVNLQWLGDKAQRRDQGSWAGSQTSGA